MTKSWSKLLFAFSVVALLGAGCEFASQTEIEEDESAAEETAETVTDGDESASDDTISTQVEVEVGTGDDEEESATPVIVEIGGDGFSPTSITIKKGTTVTFMNEGSTSHWPASDPHPTHTIYPEFQAPSEIKPGASWSFTFDKVGSWRYHDHLNSGEKALIIVTE